MDIDRYSVSLHKLLINEDTNKQINDALSTYPLYEPEHKELYSFIPTREELNKKILNYYRFYEIGSETIGRFLFNIQSTMELIMPYYNQLYKSIDIMNGLDDIFGNLDVMESYEEETTGSGSSEATGKVEGTSKDTNSSKTDTSNESHVDSTNNTNTDMDSSNRSVESTTPQSQLQAKTIDNITAASGMKWNEDSNSSSSNSNDSSDTNSESKTSTSGINENVNSQETSANSISESNSKTTHTLHRKGNQGVNTYAHDMLEFRQLFLNIEQQIINDPELKKCFMLIW